MYIEISKILERETTIYLPLTKEEYFHLSYEKDNLDVVIYTETHRVHNHCIQSKKVISENLILGFLNGFFIPLKRTVCEEITFGINEPQTEIPYIITSVVVRHILYNENNLRFVVGYQQTDVGIKYFIMMEIEYDENNIYSAESTLMNLWLEKKMELGFSNFKFDELTIDILQHPSTRLLPFYYFDPNKSYRWAFKWDGVKTRLLQTETESYLVSDLNYEKCVKSNIPYNNMYFHLEELIDDDGTIKYILFEFLEAKYLGSSYFVTPTYNVAALDYHKGDTFKIDEKYLGEYQCFYEPPLGNNIQLTEGHIIFQNDNKIKYKIPTIDGKIIIVNNKNLVLFGEKIKHNYKTPLCVDKIYEFTMSKSMELVLLRERKDRIIQSTTLEYNNFIKAINIYYNNN